MLTKNTPSGWLYAAILIVIVQLLKLADALTKFHSTFQSSDQESRNHPPYFGRAGKACMLQ